MPWFVPEGKTGLTVGNQQRTAQSADGCAAVNCLELCGGFAREQQAEVESPARRQQVHSREAQPERICNGTAGFPSLAGKPAVPASRGVGLSYAVTEPLLRFSAVIQAGQPRSFRLSR